MPKQIAGEKSNLLDNPTEELVRTLTDYYSCYGTSCE